MSSFHLFWTPVYRLHLLGAQVGGAPAEVGHTGGRSTKEFLHLRILYRVDRGICLRQTLWECMYPLWGSPPLQRKGKVAHSLTEENMVSEK